MILPSTRVSSRPWNSLGLLLLALAPSFGQAASGWTKQEAVTVLKTAEEIRSLDKAEISVDLKTVSGGQNSVYDLKILRSSGQRAHLEFLAPPEERGRRMLARERSYWSTFPDSKRVVAISHREMIGNSAFALADIFQIDSEKDYSPEIVAEEQLGKTPVLKLDLKSKHDDVPYARIEYWVEKQGYFPVKAKFFGVSGKHLKTMTVEARKELAGRLRPEVTKMVDEVIQGHVSWWKTKTMVPADVPDQVFTKDFLKGGGL